MTQLEPQDGRAWDKYSDQWGEIDEDGLGVEWGTDELTLRIFENCLRPHLTPDSHVLEIGPGGGKYSVLSAPFCARLVCADVSKQMLGRVSKALAEWNNVEILKLGGADLSGVPDESIDFAFSIDVFVHLGLEDVYGYVRDLHRVLRPGSAVVLHFANLQSRAGWGRFHRIADYNRAMRREVGRINFITAEMVTKVFEEVRFEEIKVDTKSTSPRDFIVTARKSFLPQDRERKAREQRILDRTQADSIAVDFVHRLAYGVQAPSDSSSITAKQYELGGDRRHVIYAQPDARVGFALTVPENATLCAGIALHSDAQAGGGDCGVSFRVQVVDSFGIKTLFLRTLDPKTQGDESAWNDFEIDLERFGGTVVFLVLETETPEGTHLANGACWSEPAIVLDEKRTQARRRIGTDAADSDLIESTRFYYPVAELAAERDNLRHHVATIETERDALLAHVADIEQERDALLAHVPTIERERDSLLGHVANVERERDVLADYAAGLEDDLNKIRRNRVYRLLCKIRDLFVAPKS